MATTSMTWFAVGRKNAGRRQRNPGPFRPFRLFQSPNSLSKADMLASKTAIVTGGTRGIGRAIAKLFLENHAKVAIFGTDAARAAQTASQLASECGVAPECAVGFGVDVGSASAVSEAIGRAVESLGGKVDILVNNAGITRDNLLVRMSEDEWDEVIDTDLKGVFNCVKAVARPMIRARQGRIINIASVVGVIGNIGQVNYSAAKAGVIGMTRSLARELASRNINVNAIAPGFVATAMTDALPEPAKAALVEKIPLGRVAQPEEIARVALFLAGPGADYITGQCIGVDGGLAMS